MQVTAIKLNYIVVFAAISSAQSNLGADQRHQRGVHLTKVIGHPIRGRPPELVDGVVGFRTSHYNCLQRTRKAVAIDQNATAIPWLVPRDLTSVLVVSRCR